MGMKSFKPYTPSRRNMTVLDYKEITKKTVKNKHLNLQTGKPFFIP
mgnify:CR=1 FL=1